MNELEKMLESEMTLNKKETWTKLDKTMKLTKLQLYSVEYCKKNELDLSSKLTLFLKIKINQKRLLSNKEVNYDVVNQKIVDIPNLIYTNNTFVLKRSEKRKSTLKSLTPSKKIDIGIL